MAENDTSALALPEHFTILVKNPGKPGLADFKVEVPATATLADVKAEIASGYGSKPLPANQTLIYGGRVLKEEGALLKDILGQNLEAPTHTLHLVVKADRAPAPSSTPPPARPASAPSSSRSGASAAQGVTTEASNSQASGSNGHPGTLPVHSPANGQHAAGDWSARPDPTMLAAYNAALEALRSRPPPGSGPASGGNAQQPNTSAGLAPAFMPPPFSIPPTVVLPPHFQHSFGYPGGSQPGAAPNAAPNAASGSQAAGGSQPAGATSSSQPQPQAQQEGAAGQAAAAAVRLQPFYAPTLAYVPVSLMQAQHPGAAQQQQQQPQQGQVPQFPYPPYAPLMPVMMPFNFNPYAPPMFPGNAYPVQQGQQQHGQPPPGQAFQGLPGVRQHGMNAQAANAVRPGQGQGAGARVRVRMIRINIRLLMQLFFLGLMIFMNVPRERFFKLLGGVLAACILWPLFQRNEGLRRRLLHIVGMPQEAPLAPGGPAGVHRGAAGNPGEPAGGEAPAAGAGEVPGAGGGVAPGAAAEGVVPRVPAEGVAPRAPQAGVAPRAGVNAAGQAPRGGGLVHEVRALVVGFFTSLLPGLNMNAEDAAAFAAARQILAQEQADQEGAGGQPREHFD